MKLLVTGGAGLLGCALAAEAVERGHEVVALDRVGLDVTDAPAVRRALEEHRPDAVLHCAAYTAVDRAEAEPEVADTVNRVGSAHVAAAAAGAGAVPVYVSTDYVFDGTKAEPYLPEDTPNPLSVYGRTKLDGEAATRAAAPEHLIVRTSWLYGGDNGFVPAILRRAEAGQGLRVVRDQLGRPTWAPRAAEAILDLVEAGARGVWHVAGGGQCTWLELAREAVRASGLRVDVEPVSSVEFGAPAPRPSYSVMDLTATERLLGRAMNDWRDDLLRFLEDRDG